MCTESKRIEVAGVMPHITGGPNYCVGRYSSSYIYHTNWRVFVQEYICTAEGGGSSYRVVCSGGTIINMLLPHSVQRHRDT